MINFELKDDSVETDFTVPMLLGLLACMIVYAKYGVLMVITSGSEKFGHSLQSSHYTGNAADLRTRTLEGIVTPEKVAVDIRVILTKHYQVIVESTHIHIQYKPKYSGAIK